jgi:hypothetical protein
MYYVLCIYVIYVLCIIMYLCNLCIMKFMYVLLLRLYIFIVCVCMTTLTEDFPCFFLSCKANARVKPVMTGHDPHSS